MPKLMGGDIPRHVWQRERREMGGSENDQSSTSKALRVDTDGRDVRTTRQGDNDVSFDATEARGLPSAPSADHGRAETPKHLFRQTLRRRNNRTKAEPGPYGFQLEVPVLRGFLHRDEAVIRRLTEYRNRPDNRIARSDGSANTTSDGRRARKNDKDSLRPPVKKFQVTTRIEPVADA